MMPEAPSGEKRGRPKNMKSYWCKSGFWGILLLCVLIYAHKLLSFIVIMRREMPDMQCTTSPSVFLLLNADVARAVKLKQQVFHFKQVALPILCVLNKMGLI